MMMRMNLLPRVRYHNDGRRRRLLLSSLVVVRMLRMWSTILFVLLLLFPFISGAAAAATGHDRGGAGGDDDGDRQPSLRLPTFFSHHMVISSQAPSIWGKVVIGPRHDDDDIDRGGRSKQQHPEEQDNQVVVNVRVVKGRVVSDTDVNLSSQGDWHVQLLPQTLGVGYTIIIALLMEQKQAMMTTRDAATEEGREGDEKARVVIDSITLTDVAFGDVFLCAGQSNMEMSIHGVFNASQEILDAIHYPALRMFTAGRNMSTIPEWDVPSKTSATTTNSSSSWTVSGTTENMYDDRDPFGYPSAVCYFAGRDIYTALQQQLQQRRDVVENDDDNDIDNDNDVTTPIGLVIVPWGGQPIEYFCSPTALAQCPSSSSTSSVATAALVDGDDNDDNNKGSCIWNGMVSPLTKFHFRAALWYQGEANSHDPDNYACRFPAMIADWRQQFASAPTTDTTTTTTINLPFYYVQLAPYPHEDYSYIRAAQEAAVMRLPAVYTAVTIDLGDPTSPYGAIHPRRKQTVGQRLAASILYHEYGYRKTATPTDGGDGDGPVVRDVSFPDKYNEDGTATTRVTIRTWQHQLHLQGTAACWECCYEWPFTVLDSVTGNWTRSSIVAVRVVPDDHGSRQRRPDDTIVELTLSLDVIDVAAVAGLRYAWEGYPQCVLYDGRGGGPDDQLGWPVPPFEWCRYPTGQPSWTGEACGLAERWSRRQEPPPVTRRGAGPDSDEMAVATD